MLVCFRHHQLIDDDPASYPVDQLLKAKEEHYGWVASKHDLEEVWRTKLHNFYYINVPRLNMLADAAGWSLDLTAYSNIDALHELGWSLNGLMMGFKKLLKVAELKAVPLEAIIANATSARGLIVSFDHKFRTKNIRLPGSKTEYQNAISGNLDRDPHIYVMISGYRITLTIDPRWVTSTTAFVQFRPSSGTNTFAGLGIVNSVDEISRSISISPYVIGLPSNPFLEEFYEAMTKPVAP